ncbi:ankyrin repeat-containing protein BDA1-like [Salvia miltiorrhiza]|uniref:ankyrin repeat-containing protein BDA1-like n=1 Tax=Salvia miltiorrhiza TaxID=226208 RepID=UPI0025ABACFD|nr:ankyrin repeat-containing protein BDA1-like [Salvia miltiorrhiza]
MDGCDHECECKKRSEYTATIKICECECDCNCECCIDRFYSAIEDDPKLLQRLDKIQFAHTPLHEAAESGNTVLALEVMNLMPSLAKKLNPQGLSPLHLAVVKGNVATALALVKLDSHLVRIKGKAGLTPLHHAAATSHDKCQSELLAGLLVECPESMAVLNNRRQSALHVALENQNVQAARLLVNWLVIVAQESDLSIKDAHGNTTLHVAARYCRCRELLALLTKLVKVNKANNYGETPLDIAIHHRNGDAVEVLKSAGATVQTTRGEEQHLLRRPSRTVRYLLGKHANKCAEMLTRAYFFITKELTMDMRNTILVVAVLIATTTYQGVLQPPGGVYSAEGNTDVRLVEHPPGRMVMGTTKYSYFMPTNTLAFISATLIIIFVLPDRAFVVILQACLIFMCIGYLLALNFISYYNKFSRILDIVCCCTLGVAFSLKLGYYCVKAYYNEDEWLLRRLGVMISNHKARFFWTPPPDQGGDRGRGLEMSVIGRMRQQYKLISKRVA